MKKIKPNHYTETVIYSVDMIINRLKNKLRQKISDLDIGITGEQFVVLDTINSYNDMYQQKLSDILMKDKSNTTRIIKILLDKGLITRDAGNMNNRLVYKLNVTKQGKALITQNMPKIKKFLTEIFEHISDEEIELLHQLSKKFQLDLEK